MAWQRCWLNAHLKGAGQSASAAHPRVQALHDGWPPAQTGASGAHSESREQAFPKGTGGIMTQADAVDSPSLRSTSTKQAPARWAVIVAEVRSGSTSIATLPLSQ